LLSDAVSELCNAAADKPKIQIELRLTKATAAELLTADFATLVKDVWKSRDYKSRNATKQETQFGALLALVDRGGWSKIAFEEDPQIVSELLETLSPFIEKEFGKGADNAAIWQESLLHEGRVPHDDVILNSIQHKDYIVILRATKAFKSPLLRSRNDRCQKRSLREIWKELSRREQEGERD
jgi:hypothetical protein